MRAHGCEGFKDVGFAGPEIGVVAAAIDVELDEGLFGRHRFGGFLRGEEVASVILGLLLKIDIEADGFGGIVGGGDGKRVRLNAIVDARAVAAGDVAVLGGPGMRAAREFGRAGESSLDAGGGFEEVIRGEEFLRVTEQPFGSLVVDGDVANQVSGLAGSLEGVDLAREAGVEVGEVLQFSRGWMVWGRGSQGVRRDRDGADEGQVDTDGVSPQRHYRPYTLRVRRASRVPCSTSKWPF